MPAYAAAISRPPRTLTEIEQATLLKVTGEHRDGFRDHVIFAVALGTGLREHEIAALDVGDVLHEDGCVRRRIALRTFKRSSTEPATQEVFIPDSLFYKLGKLVSWKRGQGESLAPDAPLFVSRRGRRISTRTLRYLFAVWQRRAGFDRPFNFHALRHYADLRVMPRPGLRVGVTEDVVKMHAALFEAARRLAIGRRTSVIGRGPTAFTRRRP